MNDPREVPTTRVENVPAESPSHLRWLSWSSIFFAFVQSVCAGFVALSSVRLFLGAAALAGTVGVLKFADKLHYDAIRIPMMVFALVGAGVNLLALGQARRLRRRSSSAWRQQPLSRKKKTSERLQFALAVLTIALLVAEEWAHWKLQGRG
jgi:hypothetical protein